MRLGYVSSLQFKIYIFILICVSLFALSHAISYSKKEEFNCNKLTIPEETLLLQYLNAKLKCYGKKLRPVFNVSHPTTVEFDLFLIKLEVNEQRKVLETSMINMITWKSEFLTWDPEQFGGLSSVFLDFKNLWIIDVMLLNSVNPKNIRPDTQLEVEHDGRIVWHTWQSYESACAIDVTDFPFDNQSCKMEFGSWTHTLKYVDLTLAYPTGINLISNIDYKDSCLWDVTNTTGERHTLDFVNLVSLEFQIYLKRKMVFSTYILTLPCILLSFLNVVVFCLPVDSHDRVSFSMSLFSSFFLLLLILVETSPPAASSVPRLGVYYSVNMALLFIAIVVSCLIINLYKRAQTNTKVPRWLRFLIIKGLGKLFCRGKRLDNTERTDMKLASKNVIQEMEQSLKPRAEAAQKTGTFEVTYSDFDNISTQDKEVNEKDNALDWYNIGDILDRFSFTVFLIISFVNLVVLFPKPT